MSTIMNGKWLKSAINDAECSKTFVSRPLMVLYSWTIHFLQNSAEVSKRKTGRPDGQFGCIVPTRCANRNNPPPNLEKILYFSNGSTDFKQSFRLCKWMLTQHILQMLLK